MDHVVDNDKNTYFDYHDFMCEVGMMNIFILRPLGIIPDSLSGIFDASQYEEIIEFCQDCPEYHIISYMKNDLILNHARRDAEFYYLGDGNSDPHLVCKANLFIEWFSEAS